MLQTVKEAYRTFLIYNWITQWVWGSWKEMNLNMQEVRYAKDVELDPIGGKEIYRDRKQKRWQDLHFRKSGIFKFRYYSV